ncbi:MAG: hypothetical protein H7Y10_02375 [Flavobacterium sp.]|nr:hypothetical protein [Flavobacterium sp.]
MANGLMFDVNKKHLIKTTTDLGNWLNGKLVLYLGDLLRLFTITRVANPRIGLNLIPNPLLHQTVIANAMRRPNNFKQTK